MVLRREITDRILALLEENPSGLSVTDIARSVRVNRNTAGRYLENLLVSGKAEMHRSGMSKVYVPSKRVPISAVLSISSDLVLQLDRFQRIVFANEPFLQLIGTESRHLLGKNIEFTPVVTVFDQSFAGFLERVRRGIAGEEWAGEIELTSPGIILLCRIAPTVFEDGRGGVSVFFENITQRKRAERALRESESRLRLIAENVPDLILMLNENLDILYMSRISDHSPDQVLGRSVLDFVPEKFHPAATTCFHQVRATGKTAQYGTEYYFRNGKTRYYESTVSPIIEDGRIVALALIAHDITDRKKAEDALRESEERYRTLSEASQDLIFLIGRDDRVLYVNSYAAAMLRLPADQIIGKQRSSLFPEKLAETQTERLHRVFESGEAGRSDGVMEIFGTPHYFDHYLVPVFDADGRVGSVLGISRDITERKQAEQALQESEERYRRLVEISPDVILIHQEGRIVFLNPAALTMLGVTDPREILGKAILDMIHPDFRDDVRRNIGRDLEGEMTPPTEVEMIRADGTTITVEGRGVRTTYKGRPAVQVAIRDTTERHHMDEKLRESEDKYQFFINRALDGIIVIQDDIIRVCNQRAAVFYGDSPEKIVGRRFLDFIHPDARADVADRYHRRMVGEKTPPVYETVLMRKDGSRFYAEVNAGIITYEGKPADLIFLRDINDWKKAEEAVREGPRGTGISDDLSFLVTGIKPDKSAK